jgi:ubiquinone/menaquinone biosynthesis C-methylase UbiE
VSSAHAVARHYGRPSLGEEILLALQAAGKDIEHLTPDDLAPLDELHTLGRASTVNLARLLGLSGSERVLDLGSGIGGPSRYLAKTFGCRVTGVDLTPEFCAVAAMLAARTGLNDKVDYRQADALALPFPDASFDVVWSQNVVMNIADRPRLYREIHRVLRVGGHYGFAEVAAGQGEPYFPLPWAREPSISFLVTAEATRQALATDFALVAFEDKTADVLAQNRAHREPQVLGMHVAMGADGVERMRNAARGYAEGRLCFVQGVGRRRSTD